MADFEKNPSDVQSSPSQPGSDQLLTEINTLRDRLSRLESSVYGQAGKDTTDRAATQRTAHGSVGTDINLLNLDKLFNRH